MPAYQPYETLTGVYTVSGDTYRVKVGDPTTFSISFFKNSAEKNRVDKTAFCTGVFTVNGTLRAECDIVRPSILVATAPVPYYNYVWIPAFRRWYFIVGVTSVNNGLWRFDLECDVLMTYKVGIKKLSAIIARQENNYNDNLVDTMLPVEKGETVTYQNIPNSVLKTDTDYLNYNFCISVIGGGVSGS